MKLDQVRKERAEMESGYWVVNAAVVIGMERKLVAMAVVMAVNGVMRNLKQLKGIGH